MFALIYRALMRLSGFGAPPTKAEPVASTTNPLWESWLKQPEALSLEGAVRVMERKAFPSLSVSAPAGWLIALAETYFTQPVLAYFAALAVLGLGFPKPKAGEDPKGYAKRITDLARTKVRSVWLPALFSKCPLAMPVFATDVLVQEAANLLGQQEPRPIPRYSDPVFLAEAEMQMHVVQISTDYCVFPRVVVRGKTNLEVQVEGTANWFHWDSAAQSGWEYRLRWLGPVTETPQAQIEEGQPDAASAHTPKGTTKN